MKMAVTAVVEALVNGSGSSGQKNTEDMVNGVAAAAAAPTAAAADFFQSNSKYTTSGGGGGAVRNSTTATTAGMMHSASRQLSASPLEHRQRLQRLVRALSILGTRIGGGGFGDVADGSSGLSRSLAGLLATSPLCLGSGVGGVGGAGGGGLYEMDTQAGEDDPIICSGAFTLGTPLETFTDGASDAFAYRGASCTAQAATTPAVATFASQYQPIADALPRLSRHLPHDESLSLETQLLLRNSATVTVTPATAAATAIPEGNEFAFSGPCEMAVDDAPADDPWAGIVAAAAAAAARVAAEAPLLAEQWHEVTVRGCGDPSGSDPVLLVIQTDVTRMVEAEAALVEISDADHRLLAHIFPRHVVQVASGIQGQLG
ncbi:hypothetical protein Vretimale_14885 [Volvox reticuliferus]|uniref:Uncharacterized protein n=1 Tax=Volvox reticuliferus TaxID=1737510 RepID=A0A8J4FYF7_9CHLO|nr:hypothetical protein Vretifemale_19357 [Volvox reticuliferus]GIM11380.1 hypothetical protein Vretimale_14885 [Volvox reticuliferus]